MYAPYTPGALYRCANNGVAGRGTCKLMKMRAIKIDGGIGAWVTDSQKWLSHVGEWMDGSLREIERIVYGHEADLGFLYTIQVRVKSRKFVVPEKEKFEGLRPSVPGPVLTWTMRRG